MQNAERRIEIKVMFSTHFTIITLVSLDVNYILD